VRQLRWVLPTLVCFLKAQLQTRGTLTSLPILIALLLLSSGAWGQSCSPSTPLNCAYVTDGTGHDVLAVDRITGAVTTVYSLKRSQGSTVDLRLAGDNRLYFLTSTALFRVNLDGTSFQTVFSGNSPTGFTGIRFDNSGNAFVNTPGGVWEFANLIGAAQSPFPTPTKVFSSGCKGSGCGSGGLAFTANGDLLIADNSGSGGSVVCLALGSLPSSPLCSVQQLTDTSVITGLAVDALGDIIYSSGTAVHAVMCTSSACSSVAGYPVNLSADVPAYIEAVPDPTGTPTADASPFPCNSAAPSILVSTASSSGNNGKVYSINSVASATVWGTPTGCVPLASPTAVLVATLNTKLPAVGMASAATLTTLTKPASNATPTSQFNYGNASLELLPMSSITSACNLSMTKEQLPVALVVSRLATQNVAAKAIGFDGEQSWVTGFHGAYPDVCGIAASSTTHIGIGGFYPYNNPHIAIIPDDPSVAATVDELPFVYPIAPLQGNPGDILIKNQTTGGAFTTNPATIIAVDVAFTNNAPASGYLFCGFLPPFVDPATGKKGENTVKSGQSATFKFQLGTTSCSNLVSDSIAGSITTGFSVAQFADANHMALPQIVPAGGDGKGNSVAPPTFNYDATGHQFIYTLDTTGYCNGDYEATANGDIFRPHTLVFSVISGPSCP